MKRAKKGFLITLEGPDGSGKSTQMKFLAHALSQAGIPYILTREPGGGAPSSLAESIRTLLLTPGAQAPAPETELLLFLAARAQHVRDLIRPALQRGQLVLCERFADATFAYQVGGRGLPSAFVSAANRFATQGMKPDLTLLLDIPPDQGLSRAFQAKAGHDRMESESLKFHRRVRLAYRKIARAEPKRVKVIAANQPSERVAQQIWKQVSGLLGV